MHDHLTKLNGKLISDLNNDGRIQSECYCSRKVFAIDKEGHRNKFDIMDTVSEKIEKAVMAKSVTSIYLGIGLTSLKQIEFSFTRDVILIVHGWVC